jgi:hypothetical protein
MRDSIRIDDHATYYQLQVTEQPGKPQEITEGITSGFALREAIQRELTAGKGEVEQTDPAEVTVRWNQNGRTTQSCTYSKVC